MVVRIGADRDGDADHEEADEVRAVAPPGDRGAGEGGGRNREARQEQRDAPHVGDRRLGPGPELVAAVEEPVTEAADDLRRERGERDRSDRLGVAKDVEPVARLDREPRDPPQRRHGDQDADACDGRERAPRRRLVQDPDREREPQHRPEARVEEGRRVDPADRHDDQREQRGIAPATATQGTDREGDHPW